MAQDLLAPGVVALRNNPDVVPRRFTPRGASGPPENGAWPRGAPAGRPFPTAPRAIHPALVGPDVLVVSIHARNNRHRRRIASHNGKRAATSPCSRFLLPSILPYPSRHKWKFMRPGRDRLGDLPRPFQVEAANHPRKTRTPWQRSAGDNQLDSPPEATSSTPWSAGARRGRSTSGTGGRAASLPSGTPFTAPNCRSCRSGAFRGTYPP